MSNRLVVGNLFIFMIFTNWIDDTLTEDRFPITFITKDLIIANSVGNLFHQPMNRVILIYLELNTRVKEVTSIYTFKENQRVYIQSPSILETKLELHSRRNHCHSVFNVSKEILNFTSVRTDTLGYYSKSNLTTFL